MNVLKGSVIQDGVAIIVVICTAALVWHGNITSSDYKDLVLLLVGYVFGRAPANTSGS